jgi:hypothetical protein
VALAAGLAAANFGAVLAWDGVQWQRLNDPVLPDLAAGVIWSVVDWTAPDEAWLLGLHGVA